MAYWKDWEWTFVGWDGAMVMGPAEGLAVHRGHSPGWALVGAVAVSTDHVPVELI